MKLNQPNWDWDGDGDDDGDGKQRGNERLLRTLFSSVVGILCYLFRTSRWVESILGLMPWASWQYIAAN